MRVNVPQSFEFANMVRGPNLDQISIDLLTLLETLLDATNETSLGGAAGDQSERRTEEIQEDVLFRTEDSGAGAELTGAGPERGGGPETHDHQALLSTV